eukprot:4703731-Prymnesium_polylepis.3
MAPTRASRAHVGREAVVSEAGEDLRCSVAATAAYRGQRPILKNGAGRTEVVLVCHAEIDELDVARGRDEDVLELQVAVADAPPVAVREAVDELAHIAADNVLAERARGGARRELVEELRAGTDRAPGQAYTRGGARRASSARASPPLTSSVTMPNLPAVSAP